MSNNEINSANVNEGQQGIDTAEGLFAFLDTIGLQEKTISIIEIGGTVGDIESQPFLESIRQFQSEVGRENAIKNTGTITSLKTVSLLGRFINCISLCIFL